MSLRHKLNNNPTASTVGAVVVLAVCLGLVAIELTGGPQPNDRAYFLDTNTGKLFTAKVTKKPIKAPYDSNEEGAPAAFQARIYACGQCGDYADMTLKQVREAHASVVYLTREAGGNAPQSTGEGSGRTLISKPELINWVPMMSPAASRVTRVNLQCGKNETPGICLP